MSPPPPCLAEGEYSPWERELRSGVWLENLRDEEDVCTFKARNLHIQQTLEPVDPWRPPGRTRARGRPPEGDQEGASASPPTRSTAPGRASTRHEAVRAWLESVSGEPCEDDDPEAEAGSPDVEPGTELDEEDIPSDAEAEARLLSSERGEPLPEDGGVSESLERVSSLAQSSIIEKQSEGEEVTSPGPEFREPVTEDTSKPLLSPLPPPPTPPLAIPADTGPSPGTPEEDTAKPERTPDPEAARSPLGSAPRGPDPPAARPAPRDALALQGAVRARLPAPGADAPAPPPPPRRLHPAPEKKGPAEPPQSPRQQPDSPAETPTKRADIIEEFWMKSAEIRKSLGLTPLERSRAAAPERSLTVPTPDSSSSPRSYTPEDLSDELRSPFAGRTVIRRLNITVEGQVISPVEKEPKSSGSERRDLSSSSGLGLNGSSAVTSQTAASESFNNSDSAMLTPPSSPPPPVPKEDPVKQKKSQVAWNNEPAPAPSEPPPPPPPRSGPAPSTAPEPVTSPAPTSVTTTTTTTTTTTAVVMRESSKPRRAEVRKSFIECVEEIPFADDVEDTFDERTPDNSAHERFFTPPTGTGGTPKDRPPLHLALAMENGKPKIPGAQVPVAAAVAAGAPPPSPGGQGGGGGARAGAGEVDQEPSAQDAVAKQLGKTKESEAHAKGGSPRVAWNVPEPASPETSAVKALESRKQAEALGERFATPQGGRSLEVSAASSESSAGGGGGKVKKRSSLFSPRKNKKEKKAKGEARGPEDAPKHKSLWKVVFSGYKKDKKKKTTTAAEDKSLPSTPSSSTTTDSGKRKASPLGRSSDLNLRRNLSFSEDSDLSCDDVLERSSQKSKADKAYTEEELNAKLTRKVQKAARRQAKQEELKRLHRAQIIQRQLEQVEEKQRQLEERGVAVEKALRGEADYWGESNYSEILDLHLGGMGKKDDPKLMQEWFKLVQECARELELEDRQSRLQQDLRERMAVDDHLKTEAELAEERRILSEMLEVVEQRDSWWRCWRSSGSGRRRRTGTWSPKSVSSRGPCFYSFLIVSVAGKRRRTAVRTRTAPLFDGARRPRGQSKTGTVPPALVSRSHDPPLPGRLPGSPFRSRPPEPRTPSRHEARLARRLRHALRRKKKKTVLSTHPLLARLTLFNLRQSAARVRESRPEPVAGGDAIEGERRSGASVRFF
ncbi:hypothetical protein ANANG_G00309560 [Anguilla anguilla]|uniref:BMERB domain-containing protein n=1 Tax=Anguilla anguilla TaxID=7936 RepID=A0A9D3LPI3_ANGAN|nr:hypothetical protein ANANG_G00309560 [Anguilla anguilla]